MSVFLLYFFKVLFRDDTRFSIDGLKRPVSSLVHKLQLHSAPDWSALSTASVLKSDLKALNDIH